MRIPSSVRLEGVSVEEFVSKSNYEVIVGDVTSDK